MGLLKKIASHKWTLGNRKNTQQCARNLRTLEFTGSLFISCTFVCYYLSYVFEFEYSHLSDKREVTPTDFEKFHPPQKKSTHQVIDFLDLFQKSHPPRLFQSPRLVIWQLLHLLHVYSNLHVY